MREDLKPLYQFRPDGLLLSCPACNVAETIEGDHGQLADLAEALIAFVSEHEDCLSK
jgi:hypothetical protein